MSEHLGFERTHCDVPNKGNRIPLSILVHADNQLYHSICESLDTCKPSELYHEPQMDIILQRHKDRPFPLIVLDTAMLKRGIKESVDHLESFNIIGEDSRVMLVGACEITEFEKMVQNIDAVLSVDDVNSYFDKIVRMIESRNRLNGECRNLIRNSLQKMVCDEGLDTAEAIELLKYYFEAIRFFEISLRQSITACDNAVWKECILELSKLAEKLHLASVAHSVDYMNSIISEPVLLGVGLNSMSSFYQKASELINVFQE